MVLGLSYWVFPVFSAVVWLAMLLAMLLTWVVDGSPHLVTMEADGRIPYISDIGAWKMKPVFIAMGTVSVVTFDIGFIAERWLRHLGRMAPNTSKWQKIFASISIFAAIVGAAGLILLTIFDDKNYHKVHDTMLAVFIGGYIVSAIFVCAEYQRLGIHYREFRVIRISFWLKLAFIIVELGLAIGFGVSMDKGYSHDDLAAILEWIIALIYSFYVMSYALDFLPAMHSKGHRKSTVITEDEMVMRSAAAAGPMGQRSSDPSYTGGDLPYQQNGYPAAGRYV
jgi:hypothetical protein